MLEFNSIPQTTISRQPAVSSVQVLCESSIYSSNIVCISDLTSPPGHSFRPVQPQHSSFLRAAKAMDIELCQYASINTQGLV